MGRSEKRRCLNCGEVFRPEPRNARHQRYCGLSACKLASKKASQARWLGKPENRDYHRGPEALARVQAWRAAHPGYARRVQAAVSPALSSHAMAPARFAESEQEILSEAPALAREISCNAPSAPLQDLLNAQPIVLVGLIAHIWGSALQEDIAFALNRLLQLGLDVRGGHHEHHQADP